MDFTAKFANVDRLKSELSGHRPLTQGELERLNEDFIINFTYNSNAIEGSTLTLDETAVVVRDGLTVGGKTIREHLEAIGHRDAYLYIEDLVRENEEITQRVVKNIHSLVLMDRKEDAGIYRRLPVMITGSPAKLPQPWEVPIKMERLLQDYHAAMQEFHPIERVARFHLLFESIHPFIDGNGRTGRLLMNLELMKEGYPPIDVKFTDRQKYIDAFKTWHLNDSADDMILLVEDYSARKLEEYIAMIEAAETLEEIHEPEIEPTM